MGAEPAAGTICTEAGTTAAGAVALGIAVAADAAGAEAGATSGIGAETDGIGTTGKVRVCTEAESSRSFR